MSGYVNNQHLKYLQLMETYFESSISFLRKQNLPTDEFVSCCLDQFWGLDCGNCDNGYRFLQSEERKHHILDEILVHLFGIHLSLLLQIHDTGVLYHLPF